MFLNYFDRVATSKESVVMYASPRPMSNEKDKSKSLAPPPRTGMPGYVSKVGSPSLAPPSKKIRAGLVASRLPSNAAPKFTPNNKHVPASVVDGKIAQRRAQLQQLKAKGASSNAANILARAKAMSQQKDSASKAPSATSYPMRSRPVGLSSPTKTRVTSTIPQRPLSRGIYSPPSGSPPTQATSIQKQTSRLQPEETSNVNVDSKVQEEISQTKPTSPEPEVTPSTKRLTLQALRKAASSPPNKNKPLVSPSNNKEDQVNSPPVPPLTESIPQTSQVVKKEEQAVVVNDEGEKTEELLSVVPSVVESAVSVTSNAIEQKEETTQVVPSENNDLIPEESSSTLRLVKELRMEKESKQQALKRITELEAELVDMKFQQQTGRSRREATSYATEERGRGRRRMKSPEPKRDGADPLRDMNVASRAVETVEDTFQSPLATYIVRKPYGGNETMSYYFEDGSSPLEWIQSVNDYVGNSNVKDEKTLEVLAKIQADGSVLHLYGTCCRHGTPIIGQNGAIAGFEYKDYGDVEYMDGSIGKVIYIDTEGNDGEYWLDPIYEEALKIRESYCSNVFSAALALRATETSASPMGGQQMNGFSAPMNTPPMSSPMSASTDPSPIKPSTSNIGVDTHDLPKGQSATKPVVDGKSKSPEKKAAAKSTAKPQPKEASQPEPQDNGSTDILSYFFISFFSFIFSIIWFFLMIPVRVVKVTLKIGIFLTLFHLGWMYFADNQEAQTLGAIIGDKYNIN